MDPILSQLGRLGLALLFASAAYHKARDLPLFDAILTDYRLLPAPVVLPAARALVAIEIGVSGALLFSATAPLAAIAAAAILTTYSLAIAINLARGRREIDCGCGGGAEQTLRPGLLARNALLVSLALASALPVSSRALSWLDGITLASGLAALALLWRVAGQLASSAVSMHRKIHRQIDRQIHRQLHGTIHNKTHEPIRPWISFRRRRSTS